MKLKEMLDMVPAMSALGSMKLPVKLAYRVAKILRQVQPEIEEYDRLRLSLAQKIGEKTEDGQSYSFKTPEAMAEFNSGIEGLLQEEVALSIFPIYVDELGDISIEGAHLAKLMGVVLYEGSPPAQNTDAKPLQ